MRYFNFTIDKGYVKISGGNYQRGKSVRIELGELTLEELIRLQRCVYKSIEFLTERSKRDALIELEGHAKDLGFSLESLLGKIPKKTKPLKLRYAHPNDPSITWSGRGRKPSWFLEALASGNTPESMIV